MMLHQFGGMYIHQNKIFKRWARHFFALAHRAFSLYLRLVKIVN